MLSTSQHIVFEAKTSVALFFEVYARCYKSF